VRRLAAQMGGTSSGYLRRGGEGREQVSGDIERDESSGGG
jgi:hypothetical protein